MNLINSYGPSLSNGAHSVCSFGYGMAKGFTNQLTPALYIFGMVQSGRALGYTGLTANTLSVGFGTIDTARGILDLTQNLQKMSLTSNRTDYLKIAQNVHHAVIGLAMVSNVFNPNPLTETLISAELLRRGVILTMKGLVQFQENLDLSKKEKQDWVRIGESLATTLWGVYGCIGGFSKFFNSIVSEQEKPQIKISGTETGKHAVKLRASWDHNGALTFREWYPYSSDEDLRRDYRVYSSLVKSDKEACKILEDARKMVGKPLDAAYIHAHGGFYGLLFGEGEFIHTANVEKISDCLKENLSKEAPIFLVSCNTAQSRSGDRLNFAERLAGETEHPVFASMMGSSAEDCRIKNDIYSCLLHPFRDDKIENMQDRATSDPREYNRLIRRTKDERDELTSRHDWLYNQFIKKVTKLVPVNVWEHLATTTLWQELKRRMR